MQATLRGRGLWRLVSEQEKCHESNPDKQEEWDNKVDRAFRVLTLGVKQSCESISKQSRTVPSKYGKPSNLHMCINDPAQDSMHTTISSQSEKKKKNHSKPSQPELMN